MKLILPIFLIILHSPGCFAPERTEEQTKLLTVIHSFQQTLTRLDDEFHGMRFDEKYEWDKIEPYAELEECTFKFNIEEQFRRVFTALAKYFDRLNRGALAGEFVQMNNKLVSAEMVHLRSVSAELDKFMLDAGKLALLEAKLGMKSLQTSPAQIDDPASPSASTQPQSTSVPPVPEMNFLRLQILKKLYSMRKDTNIIVENLNMAIWFKASAAFFHGIPKEIRAEDRQVRDELEKYVRAIWKEKNVLKEMEMVVKKVRRKLEDALKKVEKEAEKAKNKQRKARRSRNHLWPQWSPERVPTSTEIRHQEWAVYDKILADVHLALKNPHIMEVEIDVQIPRNLAPETTSVLAKLVDFVQHQMNAALDGIYDHVEMSLKMDEAEMEQYKKRHRYVLLNYAIGELFAQLVRTVSDSPAEVKFEQNLAKVWILGHVYVEQTLAELIARDGGGEKIDAIQSMWRMSAKLDFLNWIKGQAASGHEMPKMLADPSREMAKSYADASPECRVLVNAAKVGILFERMNGMLADGIEKANGHVRARDNGFKEIEMKIAKEARAEIPHRIGAHLYRIYGLTKKIELEEAALAKRAKEERKERRRWEGQQRN